jgi:hypothetical protein
MPRRVLTNFSRQAGISTLEDIFWEFYGALAFCPLDADDIHDLVLLSACVAPGGRHEERFPAYQVHGRNLALFISAIREDKKIPGNLAELVEFVLPSGASHRVGDFLYRQFFRTTKEMVSLDLGNHSVFLHRFSLIMMLAMNPENEQPYATREDAIRNLQDFVRSY